MLWCMLHACSGACCMPWCILHALVHAACSGAYCMLWCMLHALVHSEPICVLLLLFECAPQDTSFFPLRRAMHISEMHAPSSSGAAREWSSGAGPGGGGGGGGGAAQGPDAGPESSVTATMRGRGDMTLRAGDRLGDSMNGRNMGLGLGELPGSPSSSSSGLAYRLGRVESNLSQMAQAVSALHDDIRRASAGLSPRSRSGSDTRPRGNSGSTPEDASSAVGGPGRMHHVPLTSREGSAASTPVVSGPATAR